MKPRCCHEKSCTPEDCMILPDGKTCGDCVHRRWCENIIGKTLQDDTCDFFPRRFTCKTAQKEG